MRKIICTKEMLIAMKDYTIKHREAEDADKNVLLCTKIALNLSNEISNIYDKDKLFTEEEADKIEKVLGEKQREKKKISGLKEKINEHRRDKSSDEIHQDLTKKSGYRGRY